MPKPKRKTVHILEQRLAEKLHALGKQKECLFTLIESAIKPAITAAEELRLTEDGLDFEGRYLEVMQGLQHNLNVLDLVTASAEQYLDPADANSSKELSCPQASSTSANIEVRETTSNIHIGASEFTYRKLMAGQIIKVQVGHAEAPNKLWLQPFGLALYGLLRNMCAYYQSPGEIRQKVTAPEVGMICAVQHGLNNQFIRACVVSVPEVGNSEVGVFFVDYGNCQTLPANTLWYLPPMFTRLPGQAMPCVLSKVYWTADTSVQVLQVVNSVMFSCVVLDTQNLNFPFVDLYFSNQEYALEAGDTSLADILIHRGIAYPVAVENTCEVHQQSEGVPCDEGVKGQYTQSAAADVLECEISARKDGHNSEQKKSKSDLAKLSMLQTDTARDSISEGIENMCPVGLSSNSSREKKGKCEQVNLSGDSPPRTASSGKRTEHSLPKTGSSEPKTEDNPPRSGDSRQGTEHSLPKTGSSEPKTEDNPPRSGDNPPGSGDSRQGTEHSLPTTGSSRPKTPKSEDNPPGSGDSRQGTEHSLLKTGSSRPKTGDNPPRSGDNTPSTGSSMPKTGNNPPKSEDNPPRTGSSRPKIGSSRSMESNHNVRNNDVREKPQKETNAVEDVHNTLSNTMDADLHVPVNDSTTKSLQESRKNSPVHEEFSSLIQKVSAMVVKHPTVMLTKIKSPSEFFVHCLCEVIAQNLQVVEDCLEKYLSVLEQGNLSAHCSVSDLTVGSLCCGRYTKDNKLYRAMVMEITPEGTTKASRDAEILITYLDYGNEECLPVSRLFPLPKEGADLKAIPPAAVRCRLACILPPVSNDPSISVNEIFSDSWENEAIQEFFLLTGYEKQFKMFIVPYDFECNTSNVVPDDDDPVPVILVDESRLCINSELVEKGVACFVKPQPEVDDTWDPAAEDFLSERNSYNVEVDDVGVAVTGVKVEDERNICRFFQSAGGCFKGRRCPHRHVQPEDVYTQDQVAVCGSAGDETDMYASLPEEFSWIGVEVTAIFNPKLFYVIVHWDDLTLPESLDSKSDLSDKRALLEELKKDMTSHYNANLFYDNNTLLPAIGEVVAVRFKDDMWYRARVISWETEDSVKVFFLDYGYTVNLSLSRLRPLKLKFVQIPFQAIECSLKGVEPVSGQKWSKEAISCFADLAFGKALAAFVNRRCDDTSRLELKLFDTTTRNGKNLKKELCSAGYARRVKEDDASEDVRA